MNVPPECTEWCIQMTTTEDGQRILQNLLDDPCLPCDTVHEYFDRLAEKGQPGNCEEARQSATSVVEKDPDRFVCQGNSSQMTASLCFFIWMRLEVFATVSLMKPANILGTVPTNSRSTRSPRRR